MPFPKIGQIIAAASAAQLNSPIMLAVDADGNSLTRAEFKGEEIGVNVFAGYGHYLLQQIAAGKMKEPARIYASDLENAKLQGSREFYEKLSKDILEYLNDHPEAMDLFVQTFGRKPVMADGVRLLNAYDLRSGLVSGELSAADIEDLSSDMKKVISFADSLSGDGKDFFEYAYGVFQRRYNYNYNIVTDLRNHPWILEEITKKLQEKGYPDFKEYISKEFFYFYNLMGFTIAPDQTAKNRAYDFAQDKIVGMPGSEVFSWKGVNPLVGLRGSALEIEAFDGDFGGNQMVLDFLFDSVIEAHENTHNQAWFYVFVRTERELDILDQVIERKAAQKGKLPKQIGIMIEVPSAALVAGELAQKLSSMKDKYKKFGVQKTFFSFGTNDYSHLAAKGDREDPRMQLKIEDPSAVAAISEMKAAGFYYNDATQRLPLVYEGADVMLQLMETVVASANRFKVVTSLCGEVMTALVNSGAYDIAGKVMTLLDSFGVSMMKVRLLASMTRVDAMAATKQLAVSAEDKKVLFDLAGGDVRMKNGVIKGEIVFVDSADDLIPVVLKGLSTEELKSKKEQIKRQSLKDARSTMRTFEKIIVLSRNFSAQSKTELIEGIGESVFDKLVKESVLKSIGNDLYAWMNLGMEDDEFSRSMEKKGVTGDVQKAVKVMWQKAWDNSANGLKRRGIDWADMQYANAIIVDGDVNLEGWDVFRKDKGINPTRIKAVVKGIGAMRGQLEGKYVTVDYGAKKMYEGNLKVEKIAFTPRELPIPAVKPIVDVKAGVREDANNVYAKLVYHPKVVLAYKNGKLSDLEKIFDEYVGKLVEEVDKVAKESDARKQKWLLGDLEKKVSQIPEPVIRAFIKEVLAQTAKDGKVVLPDGWNDSLRKEYFRDLETGITGLMGKASPEIFIIDSFKRSMKEAIAANPGAFVVHALTSMNCAAFNNMRGGFLVEQVNPNPDYGLLGAARAIGDMWEINRMELTAFKEVWENLPVSARKNFGLQITELKGTQAGAVMIAWRAILKDMNIIPGQHGLEVGVN
ncbi:MAG: putative PEP-binding protein, partial [Candidatus Omnitrophota bacterium]